MKAYNIKFQVGADILNWQRFADSKDQAETLAQKAIESEYDHAKIIQIRQLTEQETIRLKEGHFRA